MFQKKRVQLTVIGKVFKANKRKILVLNRSLEEYLELVNRYLSFNSTSKTFCIELATRKLNSCLTLTQL